MFFRKDFEGSCLNTADRRHIQWSDVGLQTLVPISYLGLLSRHSFVLRWLTLMLKKGKLFGIWFESFVEVVERRAFEAEWKHDHYDDRKGEKLEIDWIKDFLWKTSKVSNIGLTNNTTKTITISFSWNYHQHHSFW